MIAAYKGVTVGIGGTTGYLPVNRRDLKFLCSCSCSLMHHTALGFWCYWPTGRVHHKRSCGAMLPLPCWQARLTSTACGYVSMSTLPTTMYWW